MGEPSDTLHVQSLNQVISNSEISYTFILRAFPPKNSHIIVCEMVEVLATRCGSKEISKVVRLANALLRWENED